MKHFLKLWKSKKAQTMVEYGLLVGLLSILLIATLIITGEQIRGFFTTINECLTNPSVPLNCVH